MSLRNRLALGFAIPIIFLILAIAIIIRANTVTSSGFTTVSEVSLPIVSALEELKFSGSRLISSSNELALDTVLGGDAEDEGGEIEEIREIVTTYNTVLSRYRSLIEEHYPNDLENYRNIEAAGQQLLDIAAEIIELVESEAPISDILETRQRFESAETTFFEVIESALALGDTELANQQEAVSITSSRALIAAFGFTIVAIAISLTIAWYIFWSITRPVAALKSATENMTTGNLKTRTNLTTTDELGELGRTFDEMADRIETLVSEMEEQVTVSDEARARAERSDQVKSAFLASMSHELRTPLNAVINFTKFVAKGDLGPVNEEQEETLNEVVDSAKHLLNLINDVLDMSKIDSGSLNLFIQDDVSVKEILETATSMGKSLLGKKSVELQLDSPANLPTIRADKQRILQILLNIMSNACKFTDEGYINVKASHTASEIVITVKDTGPGIAPEDQSLVFEAFKQTSTGLQKGAGTGLGMPISRHLAEVHGGRLWLESQPGQGSTFFVALPIKSEELVPLVLA